MNILQTSPNKQDLQKIREAVKDPQYDINHPTLEHIHATEQWTYLKNGLTYANQILECYYFPPFTAKTRERITEWYAANIQNSRIDDQKYLYSSEAPPNVIEQTTQIINALAHLKIIKVHIKHTDWNGDDEPIPA